MRRLATILALGAASAPAHAAEPDWVAQRLEPSVDVRTLVGTTSRSGMWVQLYAAGAQLRLTPSFHVRALAGGLRLNGRAEEGNIAPYGLGGEAGLHLSPWPDGLFRPHVFASAGFWGFPSDPFIPGGSRYDFMTRGGFGLDVSASEHVIVGVELFAAHISNGQGLGEQNPALDGRGAGVHLAYGLGPRADLPGEEPTVTAAPSYVPAVVADGAVGIADGELIGVGRARVAQRLFGRVFAIADGEAGQLAGVNYGEIGVAVATHLSPATFGAHAGYRRFAGIDIAVATLQAEGHFTPAFSAVGMGHYEGSVFGDAFRSGWGVRAYPLPSLVLEAGVGIGPIASRFEDATAFPFAGVEWALPLSLGSWQLALFAESQVSELRIAGLRVGYGVGEGPRRFARERGWRRLR
jgi:hypothetical protein